MARKGKKRKFSSGQIVVIRYSDRKLVGKVVLIRPVGKKFFYDVECEDGKIYSELLVDSAILGSIYPPDKLSTLTTPFPFPFGTMFLFSILIYYKCVITSRI